MTHPDPLATSVTTRSPRPTASVSPLNDQRLWLIATLLFVLPVLLRGIGNGEFYLNTDEPVHAVGGLFFADVLRDWPLADPLRYAYRWYAHYPALGLTTWPPLFYVVEGIFFLTLGPSAPVARLAVLSFALFGLYFWFRIVADLLNPRAAVVATVLLAFAPSVLLFEQSAMLEVPALSLCLAASCYWLRYLLADAPRPRDLYAFALLAGLALLTKQHSAYLVPFCLLTLASQKKLARLATLPMLMALGLVLAVAGPFYVLALGMKPQSLAADMLRGAQHGSPLVFYPSVLPAQLGYPLLALSIVGFCTWRWWTGRAQVAVLLAWIVACYLTFSFLAQKEARYVLYWVPAFVAFAVGPLSRALAPGRMRWFGIPTLVGVLAYQTWGAWNFQRPYVSGYEAAMRRLMERGNPGIVLFDGALHGNLIFYARVHDPERQSVILRKALYVTLIRTEYGSKELVRDREQLQKVLDAYGIRYVVVDNSPHQFDSQALLREMLNQPPFHLVSAFPIESNVPTWKGRELLLYENPNPPAATAEVLRIGMMTLPSDIEIPMKELPFR